MKAEAKADAKADAKAFAKGVKGIRYVICILISHSIIVHILYYSIVSLYSIFISLYICSSRQPFLGSDAA